MLNEQYNTLIALVIFKISASFVIGKVFGLYKINIPEENIIVKTVKCIWVSDSNAMELLN
jgi:hypothetical protein